MIHVHKKEKSEDHILSDPKDYCSECGKDWDKVIDEQATGIVAIIFMAIGVIIGIVITKLWIG